MERELYRQLYRIVWPMGERFACPRTQHSTRRIAMVYFWALLHDRPISWATQPGNWPRGVDQPRLPSNATMSRRLRHPKTVALMQAVSRHVRRRLGHDPRVLLLDGKPLPIGGLGGDPDAAVGYGAGKCCRGYKLHALCDTAGTPVAWTVTTMREPEWKVAGQLLAQLPAQPGYIVADGNYEKSSLYEQAAACGRHLVAPPRRGKALGHRSQSEHRLAALSLDSALRRRLLSARGAVERMFANLCSGTTGLSPLPSWVRRRHRVQRWVEAKITLYCLRTLRRRCLRQQEVA